jgi:hypothetical protein
MRRIIGFWFAGIYGAAFASCVPAFAQNTTVRFEQISPDLSRYGAVDWSARWDRAQISVCWLNHPEYTQERAWVRDQVSKTWEAASSVRFTGWRNCTPAGADVRITVDESGPRAYVGRRVIGQSPSMWLNFTFNIWSPREPLNKSVSTRPRDDL